MVVLVLFRYTACSSIPSLASGVAAFLGSAFESFIREVPASEVLLSSVARPSDVTVGVAAMRAKPTM